MRISSIASACFLLIGHAHAQEFRVDKADKFAPRSDFITLFQHHAASPVSLVSFTADKLVVGIDAGTHTEIQAMEVLAPSLSLSAATKASRSLKLTGHSKQGKMILASFRLDLGEKSGEAIALRLITKHSQLGIQSGVMLFQIDKKRRFQPIDWERYVCALKLAKCSIGRDGESEVEVQSATPIEQEPG